jgi:thioredoxin-disulfide reductase
MKYDLIIIGAGPAGVSAAVYAARQKLSILILSKDIGGQVAKKAVEIENYPGYEKVSGPELVEHYQKQLEMHELSVTHGVIAKIEKKNDTFFVTTEEGETYEGICVIAATGAQSRHIDVPGEEEYAGKGVSYCSLCDGPIYKNKTVAVVGGGGNAFESAIFLSNYVKQIYMLVRTDNIKADKENQDEVAKHPHIQIITNAVTQKIEGETFVNSITYKDATTGEEKKLAVDGVFVEIGYIPSTSFLEGLVEMNDNKEVIVDPKTLGTKTEGLFSAGDCNVSRYKQIILASGQGALAALSAYDYIKKSKK